MPGARSSRLLARRAAAAADDEGVRRIPPPIIARRASVVLLTLLLLRGLLLWRFLCWLHEWMVLLRVLPPAAAAALAAPPPPPPSALLLLCPGRLATTTDPPSCIAASSSTLVAPSTQAPPKPFLLEKEKSLPCCCSAQAAAQRLPAASSCSLLPQAAGLLLPPPPAPAPRGKKTKEARSLSATRRLDIPLDVELQKRPLRVPPPEVAVVLGHSSTQQLDAMRLDLSVQANLLQIRIRLLDAPREGIGALLADPVEASEPEREESVGAALAERQKRGAKGSSDDVSAGAPEFEVQLLQARVGGVLLQSESDRDGCMRGGAGVAGRRWLASVAERE